MFHGRGPRMSVHRFSSCRLRAAISQVHPWADIDVLGQERIGGLMRCRDGADINQCRPGFRETIPVQSDTR